MQGDAVHFGAYQYIFRKHWTPSAVLSSVRSKTLCPTEWSFGIQGSFQRYGFIVHETKHHHHKCSKKNQSHAPIFLCESFTWSTGFHNFHFHGLATAGPAPFSPGWRPAGWEGDAICSPECRPLQPRGEGNSLTKLHCPSKGQRVPGIAPGHRKQVLVWGGHEEQKGLPWNSCRNTWKMPKHER